MKHVRRLRRAVRLLHRQRRALLREVLVNRRRLREAAAHVHPKVRYENSRNGGKLANGQDRP